MVELKSPFYENTTTDPPFAEATPADPPAAAAALAPAAGGGNGSGETDLLMLDATSVDEGDEQEPLVAASATEPSTSGGFGSLSGDASDPIPVLPTDQEELERSRKIGAGVASGAVGFLLGGPIFGMLLGFGAAYAADKDGAAGDTARAVGDLALTAREKAKGIDEKHHVVDKSKVAASEAWEKAQELDRQHKILERTRAFLVVSWAAVADFVKKHNLVERGVEGVGKALYWVAEKIADRLNRDGATASNGASTPANDQPPPQYEELRKH